MEESTKDLGNEQEGASLIAHLQKTTVQAVKH